MKENPELPSFQDEEEPLGNKIENRAKESETLADLMKVLKRMKEKGDPEFKAADKKVGEKIDDFIRRGEELLAEMKKRSGAEREESSKIVKMHSLEREKLSREMTEILKDKRKEQGEDITGLADEKEKKTDADDKEISQARDEVDEAFEKGDEEENKEEN